MYCSSWKSQRVLIYLLSLLTAAQVCTALSCGTDNYPCQNGATCKKTSVRNYQCVCLPGYEDVNCSTNIDDCASRPCMNGQCTDLVNSYNCSCYSGWEGSNCSINHDDCFAGACLNAGRCLDHNGTYSCDCTGTGYYGSRCDINIDDCAPNPCKNGATCVDGYKSYSCSCYDGYTGINCSEDILDCIPHKCKNNALCLERSNPELYNNPSQPAPFNGPFSYSLAFGFVCVCPTGAYGDTCSVNPDDCVLPGTNQSVCAHASSCTDGLALFTCHCLAGYEGANCSVDINECELFRQPCRNGAVCKDLLANYACTDCPIGFGSKNCSVRLTGCDSAPCRNGATCEPTLLKELPTPEHGHLCTCSPGWTGPQCNLTTVVSLNGSASFSALLSIAASSSSAADWTFEFSFRSSLTQFDLIRLSSDSGLIRVGAHNSSLVLLLLNASSSAVIGQTKWPISDSVAASDWLTLSVSLTNGSATLTRTGSSGVRQSQLVDGLSHTFKRGSMSVRVGGDGASTSGGFRGCVRDVRLATFNSTFVAMETTVESHNATWGVCSRSVQCGSPSPCELRTSSMCLDVWNDFVCQCAADFGGRNCSVQLPSFSFGLGGNASSASFASVPAVSSVYGGDSWMIELRLLTLSPGAFLMLLGDLNDSATTPRLLVTIDSAGLLSTQLLLSNGSSVAELTSSVLVATGSFVNVTIYLSITGRDVEISLTVASSMKSASLSSVAPLPQLSSQLNVGGFSGAPPAPVPKLSQPSSSGRRLRRSVPVIPLSVASAAGNVTAFRGVLSPIRLNGESTLLLGSVASSLIERLPGAMLPSSSESVVTGAMPENFCDAFRPCKNGATCTNVFYNSYSCQCAVGWRGAECADVDFVLSAGLTTAVIIGVVVVSVVTVICAVAVIVALKILRSSAGQEKPPLVDSDYDGPTGARLGHLRQEGTEPCQQDMFF